MKKIKNITFKEWVFISVGLLYALLFRFNVMNFKTDITNIVLENTEASAAMVLLFTLILSFAIVNIVISLSNKLYIYVTRKNDKKKTLQE